MTFDVNGETKKDMIARLIKEEPFQTIKEIAEKVNTTRKYCRVAMDIENISIMKERKKKARRLESEVERLKKENKQLKRELEAK